MSIATLIRSMAAAGAGAEAIAIAVEAIEAEQIVERHRKAKQAERKARQRERDKAVTVTGQSQDSAGTGLSPKKETSPTPPKEKTTPIHCVSERAREFGEFWAIFPNKVGKRDAEKVFAAARQRASFETILAGVRRYAAKTDDRPWCNPTTFLNQDRWTDQPALVPPRPQSTASPAVETVSSLSRKQLFTSRTEIDVTDYSSGRVEPRGSGRLPEGAGDARPFAISGDVFGRI